MIDEMTPLCKMLLEKMFFFRFGAGGQKYKDSIRITFSVTRCRKSKAKSSIADPSWAMMKSIVILIISKSLWHSYFRMAIMEFTSIQAKDHPTIRSGGTPRWAHTLVSKLNNWRKKIKKTTKKKQCNPLNHFVAEFSWLLSHCWKKKLTEICSSEHFGLKRSLFF